MIAYISRCLVRVILLLAIAAGVTGCIESDYDLSDKYAPLLPLPDGRYLYREDPSPVVINLEREGDRYVSDTKLMHLGTTFWVYKIEDSQGYILKFENNDPKSRKQFSYAFAQFQGNDIIIKVLSLPDAEETWTEMLPVEMMNLVIPDEAGLPFLRVRDEADTVHALEIAARQQLMPVAALRPIDDFQLTEPKPQPVVPSPNSPDTGQGMRVALVIGNSNYANVPKLPNPLNDATLIAKSLRTAGFSLVLEVSDLSRDQMLGVLRSFATEADAADWAVIYFAGHGMEVGGTNYLVPTDARLRSDRDVQDEAVSLDRVLSTVEGADTLRVVILDACRDNPFARTMERTLARRAVSRGLARVEPQQATLIAYSAKEGTLADDGTGENSPYAAALAARLTQPGVEIDKVLRLVHDDVLAATNGEQEPYFYGSLPGHDFFFMPPTPILNEAVALPNR
jgi:hypothetical protein